MQPLAEWPQDRRPVSDSGDLPASGPDRSVSPGPATNTSSAAYAFEERVTATPARDTTAGDNTSSAAYAFEQRVSQGNL